MPKYSSPMRRTTIPYKWKNKRYVLTIIATFLLVGLLIVLISRKSPDNDIPNTEVSISNIRSGVSYAPDMPSQSVCDGDPGCIPDYAGTDSVVINDNIPNFTDWDCQNISGQAFSNLDSFGRCGTAVAMLSREMMPVGKREDIGSVKPTGWIQNKYPGIVDSDPPYLYNRCHLIAYALTGENANELNLITGTRYMNATTMLPWEETVMKYLDHSDNHVLYRVTPYFKGDELLARGVEMEAYSVEDNGKSICYHVFIYNIQPGIVLDYDTGENRAR